MVTRSALLLAAYTFVRTGELRAAEWLEFNLDAAEWRIPPEQMKMRAPHFVPLARQAVNLLVEVRALTGRSRWVFPNERHDVVCPLPKPHQRTRDGFLITSERYNPGIRQTQSR
jgi:integrase